MTTIHEYRQQVEHKLHYLEMEAHALEDDLKHTTEQVTHKYEMLKMALREELITVKQKLHEFKQLTVEQRKLLITKIDEVQIMLALGKVDTEQKVRDQKQKIMTCMKDLEQTIDRCLKQKSTDLGSRMIHASDKLEAEFESLEIFFCLQTQKAKERLRINKDRLFSQLQEFTHKLAEKSHLTAQKSLLFEKEITKGFKTIKNAFLHLKD